MIEVSSGEVVLKCVEISSIVWGNVLVFLIGLTIGALPLWKIASTNRRLLATVRANAHHSEFAKAMAELERRLPNAFASISLEADRKPVGLLGYQWHFEWRILTLKVPGSARAGSLRNALNLLDAQLAAAKSDATDQVH